MNEGSYEKISVPLLSRIIGLQEVSCCVSVWGFRSLGFPVPSNWSRYLEKVESRKQKRVRYKHKASTGQKKLYAQIKSANFICGWELEDCLAKSLQI